MNYLIFIISLIFLFNSNSLIAQDYQSKSPKRAAIYSAIVPGMGQIYNKKYWKPPIIYTAFGLSIFYIHENNTKYEMYKDEYLKRINGEGGQNLDLINYQDNDLRTLKDFYRRNREISYLSLVAAYLLNIIDASVDAHLFEYDISNKLTMHITPIVGNGVNYLSLSIKL